MMKSVLVEDLSAGYNGGKDVISGISFEVNEGEILTLIGPNGGGKSTVLKTVSGYIPKSGGRVELCGQDMGGISGADMAKMLSVMLTERIRPDLMTCRDVAAAGRYPYTGTFGVLTAEDHRIVDDALRAVNAEELADTDFNSVSDGQRQRVLLARAICQQPRILILDEPTSYLDIRHKIMFFEILKRQVEDLGIAVIMSLHELDFAERVSDKVLCIKDGRIFLSGKPNEIFSEENIRALYDIPGELYGKYFL